MYSVETLSSDYEPEEKYKWGGLLCNSGNTRHRSRSQPIRRLLFFISWICLKLTAFFCIDLMILLRYLTKSLMLAPEKSIIQKL